VTPDTQTQEDAEQLALKRLYNQRQSLCYYSTLLQEVLFHEAARSKQVVQRLAGDGFDKTAEDVVAFEKKLADVTPDTQTQEDLL
jgi:hypothetical protein